MLAALVLPALAAVRVRWPRLVPAGVATNQYMTLRGVGNAGARGGQRGDVHVIFEVADDPRFERDRQKRVRARPGRAGA